ncbi:hypothetical protein BDGGKGIB_00524 [Nodularia sphaerocarpa UHCC 0038]|nr:hypothetical protein BDGGKGIB_00524 [Nodularia sphaerocarpa UHCC 0038]
MGTNKTINQTISKLIAFNLHNMGGQDAHPTKV